MFERDYTGAELRAEVKPGTDLHAFLQMIKDRIMDRIVLKYDHYHIFLIDDCGPAGYYTHAYFDHVTQELISLDIATHTDV